VAVRVVSLIRSAPVALRGVDPVLEANAYAVAEAVDLAVVLTGPAIELALAGSEGDLRALLESGVSVYASSHDVGRLGLRPSDLVPGVRIVDGPEVAEVLRAAEAVLAW
jgi:intracellular sulfur oxidation DsrE/DsrF family protein